MGEGCRRDGDDTLGAGDRLLGETSGTFCGMDGNEVERPGEEEGEEDSLSDEAEITWMLGIECSSSEE